MIKDQKRIVGCDLESSAYYVLGKMVVVGGGVADRGRGNRCN